MTDTEAPKGPILTHSQSINRLKEINTELERLAELNELSPEDDMYFAELTREFDETDNHRKRLERSAELARVRAASTGLTATSLRTERGSITATSSGDYDKDAILEPDSIEECRFRNPWDLTEVRTYGRDKDELTAEFRSRALAACERMQGASDKVREAATKIVEKHGRDSALTRQIIATSSPTYLRAWAKMARGLSHGVTPEEARSLSEARAMSLTDTAGGFLVPFQVDPAVILTSNGSRNDIRQFAREVIATGDVWNGVSAGAVSWSWDAEGAEVSDDSPTFAQPTIPIHKARGFVPISEEALADEANVTAAVAMLLSEGKDELEAVTLVTGTGSGQPTGLVTALDGTSAEMSPATAETFALADIYAVQGALPARHRARASWLANNTIYNSVRQFDTSGGAGLWERVGADRPALLLGRPAGEAEAMDATINPAATADNFVLVYGNFQHYIIADRIGTTVRFIPDLFHTSNNRPSGQSGWYAYFRMGANVSHAGAFKMLNVATAA